MNTLRSLRLWHWRKVLYYRATAESYEREQRDWDAKHNPPHRNSWSANKARNARREEARHLSAVEALNAVVPGAVEHDA